MDLEGRTMDFWIFRPAFEVAQRRQVDKEPEYWEKFGGRRSLSVTRHDARGNRKVKQHRMIISERSFHPRRLLLVKD